MKKHDKLDNPDILQYIFHPRHEEKPPARQGCVDFPVEIDEDTLIGCRLYLHDKASPTLLYFHGNGETVSDYCDIAPLYNDVGLNIILATYRGYGWSGGTPTVASMMNDCSLILEKSREVYRQHHLSGDLFVMGRSLGSAAALELASTSAESFKGIILESGFADTLPLLANMGLDPVRYDLQEEDGFGNRKKIAEVTMPTLILHGSADTLIPIPQAEKLQSYSGAKTKKFFVIPGADHNTMVSTGAEHYFATIKTFINDVTGQNSWRKRRKTHKSAEKK